MDRDSYEKLAIREAAKPLKKYGSTSSKNVTKNENYIKHYVTDSDTLQGIALKYDVTIERIRRANKLWASDSLFLKEYLLIPVNNVSLTATPFGSTATTPVVSPDSNSHTSLPCRGSFEDNNINEFLGKIDASIAVMKKEVRKTQNNSEFISSIENDTTDRRRQLITRINNNGSSDFYSAPQAVVVHQGKKVKSSIQRHEKQQDEIFEL